MENHFYNLNPTLDLFGVFGETLKEVITIEVEKKVGELLEEYDAIKSFRHSTITSDDLCKRWSICKNSLRNLEKDDVIVPLPVGGKTKVYSMSDVLMVEEQLPKFRRIA